MELREMYCAQLDKDTRPMSVEEVEQLLSNLTKGWRIIEGNILTKEYPFENFNREMLFVNDVAAIAEKENHFPDICIRSKSVTIELTSQVINGLSINDFILAAKIDEI